MPKWNISGFTTFVRSFRRKSGNGCDRGLKPGLPPDPNVGKVSFIAPHTRGNETLGREQEGIPDVLKDQVRY